MLLTPRTRKARIDELETSVIELQALGMDHQATIDMLMQVINRQQLQHANELQRMELQATERERRLEQQQAAIRDMTAEYRHGMRLEIERNRTLEARLSALERRR